MPSESELYDCALIDDDEMIRAAWRLAARKAGQRLLALDSGSAFFSHAAQLNRSVPIYIDYSVARDPSGASIIEQLSVAGFTNLYVETGYDEADVDPRTRSLLKGVVGKTPPWVTVKGRL